MLVLYAIFYGLVFKFISQFLPYEEDFSNRETNYLIRHYLFTMITLTYIVFMVFFKNNYYVLLFLLFSYVIVLKLSIKYRLFIPIRFYEHIKPYIKQSLFIFISFIFVIILSFFKENKYLLLLILLSYLLILKFLPKLGLLSSDNFYNIIYPFFYIIVFISVFVFLTKIKDFNLFHIFQY